MATDLMGLTEYQKLLDAVGQYYGVGSDQWLTIASQSNIQSTEWAQILSQTPNVNVTLNNAGEVVSYTVSDAWGTATENAASAVINSNTQAATMANPSTVNVPANTTVTQTGTVAAESGMKTAAAGTSVTTVIADVALGIGAVAAGIQLGTRIDETLYNLDPDFWNEHGMSTLNPQTWDSICSTKMGKNVFNMVFGIDNTSGKTQAYMDERAFAYIAAYMNSQGAFDTGGGESADIDDHTGISAATISHLPFDCGEELIYTGPYISGGGGAGAPATNAITITSHTDPVYVIAIENTANTYPIPALISKSSFSGKATMHNAYGNTDEVLRVSTTTVNNKTIYFAYASMGATQNTVYQTPTPINYYEGINFSEIAYVVAYGEVTEHGGVEGITPQTGAVLPVSIPAGTDINAVLAYLQTLYPDLFDDAIYNDVVQPDGSVKRYTYVPVGFPDGYILDQTTGDVLPTGGETTTQTDPTIDPTTATDSLIDTLLKILESTDPYNPTRTPDDVTTDYPETGGGTTPPFVIPTGSASALYSVYNPSQAQLNSLGAWLWSSNFVDQLLKLFNDPMQAIIGLHKVFVTPPISGAGSIKVGYLDSGVSANLVSAQYTEVDCGTVQLKEYFGNALDYIKTDIYLYLPFVGIVPLNVEDVTRASINVKYKVDVLTGACLASVNVTRDLNAGGQLYVYAGNCAVQYPLSSGSYMGIVASALGIAGSVAGSILSGGALLPMALGVGASALGGARTKVEHSGSLSGNSGAMGIKKPYLIIRRPQTKIANNYEILAGVSQNEYGVLSSYTGQTRVKYVHLENIPATDKELTQIEELLKSGVLI